MEAITPVELPRRTLRVGGLVPLLGSLAVAMVIVALWQLGSASFLVAQPSQTAQVLWDGLFGRGWMVEHAQTTFSAVFIGFLLSIVAGVLFGVLLGVSWYWRSVFQPIILSAYSIPKIILFPILLIFLGIGLQSKIAMAFIHALFPLLISVTIAVRDVDPVLVKVGRSMRANAWQMLTKIYLPAIALPFVVGLRMGYGLSIIGVVLAELYVAERGLGLLIIRAYSSMQFPRMFAIILLLFVVSFGGNLLLWWAERVFRSRFS